MAGDHNLISRESARVLIADAQRWQAAYERARNELATAVARAEQAENALRQIAAARRTVDPWLPAEARASYEREHREANRLAGIALAALAAVSGADNKDT